MNRVTPYAGGTAVLLAMLFGVTACSGEQATDPTPSSTSTSAEETQSGEPTAEPTPSSESEEPASGGSQHTADELLAVLTTINEAESLNAQVISDEEIEPLLEEGAGSLGEIVVTPEECNVFAQSDLPELATEATLAVMTFAGESSLQPDTLSLSSVPSAETVAQQLAASRTQLDECSEFEMEISSQVVSATVQELEVDTNADEEIAVQTTVQVPGSIQESVSVTGAVGSTTINVLVGSSGDAQADVQRAAGIINLAVAELENL